jgi:hypothetical protein
MITQIIWHSSRYVLCFEFDKCSHNNIEVEITAMCKYSSEQSVICTLNDLCSIKPEGVEVNDIDNVWVIHISNITFLIDWIAELNEKDIDVYLEKDRFEGGWQ